jgi:hypothetical protein
MTDLPSVVGASSSTTSVLGDLTPSPPAGTRSSFSFLRQSAKTHAGGDHKDRKGSSSMKKEKKEKKMEKGSKEKEKEREKDLKEKEREKEKDLKEKEKPFVQMKGVLEHQATAASGRVGGGGPFEGEQLSGLYPEIHRLVEELKWKMDSTLFSLHKQHRVRPHTALFSYYFVLFLLLIACTNIFFILILIFKIMNCN